MVSTAGILEKIRQLADDGVRFNLALSLHAAKETTRTFLVPVNKAYPLSEIAGKPEIFRRKNRNPSDFPVFASERYQRQPRRCKKLWPSIAANSPIKINIIEYNNVEGSGFHHSPDKNRDALHPVSGRM